MGGTGLAVFEDIRLTPLLTVMEPDYAGYKRKRKTELKDRPKCTRDF